MGHVPHKTWSLGARRSIEHGANLLSPSRQSRIIPARMRVGLCIQGEPDDLHLAERLGFRAMEWMRFAESPAGPVHADWQGHADHVAGMARSLAMRISAIGAWYRNPFAPGQEESARSA